MKIRMFVFFIIFVLSLLFGMLLPETISVQSAAGWVAFTSLFSFWIPEMVWKHYDKY